MLKCFPLEIINMFNQLASWYDMFIELSLKKLTAQGSHGKIHVSITDTKLIYCVLNKCKKISFSNSTDEVIFGNLHEKLFAVKEIDDGYFDYVCATLDFARILGATEAYVLEDELTVCFVCDDKQIFFEVSQA